MEKYRITINDKVYEVEVEKLDASAEVKTTPSSSPALATPAGQTLNSPIQGTVLKVLVKPGQSVKRGEPVVVIEAMKLENDVVSEIDGVIGEVLVSERDVVNSDQPIISYRG